MILQVNHLLTDDSHIISNLIFHEIKKDSTILMSAADENFKFVAALRN